jgi:hypothetical protein
MKQIEISESVGPFTFHSMSGKCEYITVDEMCVVVALFMLPGTVQNAYTYIMGLLHFFSKNFQR